MMILLRRWQRYVRYLVVLVGIGLLVTLVRQADLNDSGDYDEYYEYKYSGRRNAGRLEKLTGHDQAGGDLRWLPGLKRRGGWRKTLPVVVVEEHYEVLQYWFQAAELGIIPKSKNTLVHIDAHADLEVPEMSNSMSWFRYPRLKKEVASFMQNTDSYIVSAVQSGLVDRIVWIMPSWDRERSVSQPVNIWFKFGTQMRRTPGDHKQNFCSCWVHLPLVADTDKAWGDNLPSDDVSSGWRCHANEFNPLMEEDNGSEINPVQCSVHTSGLLQLVDEVEGQSLMKSLVEREDSRRPSVLLDINEDFFGCWSDVLDLNSLGLTTDQTDMLSSLVAELFCADTTFDERVGDMFYAAILNLLVNIKLQSCEVTGELSLVSGNRRRTCYTSLEMSNLLIEKIPRIIKFLNEVGESQHILCLRWQEPGPDSPVAGQLQSLVLYLQNFSVKQLQHLAWLGICFDEAPTSVDFQPPRPLKLCQGQSRPNHTAVPIFLPQEVDIDSSADSLTGLLSSLENRPNLISVCRSVRDGYTPKNLFHTIESKVMDSIKSAYGSYVRQDAGVHFDSNLLGGKLGWSRRFPSWNNKLLKYLSVDVVADHYTGA